MAYAATVTIVRRLNDLIVTVAETDCSNAAGAEWDTKGDGTTVTLVGSDLLPVKGRIMRYQATLVSGTGTTLDPVVGPITDPGATANLARIAINNGTAAQPIDLSEADGFAYYAIGGQLFGRSVPNNATVDHVVTTQFLVKPGWG